MRSLVVIVEVSLNETETPRTYPYAIKILVGVGKAESTENRKNYSESWFSLLALHVYFFTVRYKSDSCFIKIHIFVHIIRCLYT